MFIRYNVPNCEVVPFRPTLTFQYPGSAEVISTESGVVVDTTESVFSFLFATKIFPVEGLIAIPCLEFCPVVTIEATWVYVVGSISQTCRSEEHTSELQSH